MANPLPGRVFYQLFLRALNLLELLLHTQNQEYGLLKMKFQLKELQVDSQYFLFFSIATSEPSTVL